MNYDGILITTPFTEQYGSHAFLEHADPQDMFEKNLALAGKKWYYADNPITYNFNSSGYRMCEFCDVDYDNYIIFFGCSNTVGIGLELEQTYSYKIAQELGCSYINAGIGGASPDFVVNNFVHFMSRVDKLPRAVIINWPIAERTFYWGSHNVAEFKIPSDVTTRGLFKKVRYPWEDSYKEFLLNPAHIERRMQFLRETVKVICKANNIILQEFTTYQTKYRRVMRDVKRAPLCDDKNILFNTPIQEQVDILHLRWARDIKVYEDDDITAHPGHDHQRWVKNLIVKNILSHK